MPQLAPLQTDLLIHAICFLAQAGVLLSTGIAQQGTTPPWMFPIYFILSALTLMRIHERVPQFGTRLVYVPAAMAALMIGLCLLIDMPRAFWGFMIPRHLPIGLRALWMQLTLLLLHPDVFAKMSACFSRWHEWLQTNGYYGCKIWILAVIAVFVLWLARSQNISLDGFDWLRFTVPPKHWVLYLREPLGLLIFRAAAYWGIKLPHWDPYCSITLVTILCGVVTTFLLGRVSGWVAPKPFAAPLVLLLVSCCGYTQVFAGNIEIYAVLHVGLALFLYAAMKYVRDDWPAWAPGLAFGILFCIHLSAGWWIPAFLLLPLLKYYKRGAAEKPFYDVSLLYTSALLFIGVFWMFLLQHGYNGNVERMVAHFFSDQVMYVGTDAAMFRPIQDYLTPDYYLTMANEFFYLAPAAVVLLPVIFLGFRRWGTVDPVLAWIGCLAFFYFAYSITWRPDRLFPIDWDLFSGLTVPAVLLFGGFVARMKVSKDAALYLLYQATAFSFLYLLLQLTRNHFKVTAWPMYL
ncbi:MAG: hypothetical protein P9L94_18725 [Candidatus Hinthialibacter antarcticus]|nr:hypothetical protein [Candidatus Hinthialibacter antarcticus]